MPEAFIDAHQHFWEHARNPQDWISPGMEPLTEDFGPARLAPELARRDGPAGFARSVLVQATHSDAETDWYLDLAEAHPRIAGVVGWVDLTSEALDDRLDELAERPKLRGIRHVVQAEPDDRWLLSPAVLRGLERLRERGLRFDLLILTKHLPLVPELCERLPGLPMVIDHLAKPPLASGDLDGWRRGIDAAARCEGLHAKLSGLVTEADHARWTADDLAPAVRHAVDCFGPDRLMAGSDWPVCLLAASHPRTVDVLEEILPRSADPDAIFGGTARRFYGLDPAPAASAPPELDHA
ncbi:amidohydrolase family protein [Phycisphaera mikurensis]|uniref:Putative hydrolase n=1 Tax=Phycisphaera mikurensis (strain NBRC 102666 / KCTC 22515 / FYK2301M01) TaxID=1142394 RepID=I0IEV1_PHYMF|nr:amidohydrolase family protein [Phycisphaera mikurensis]MBB6441584.1 L-fuconolactonase [Phycisphaera mikurensis]BAM03789.1 putative hydrolase [Phycisphaera mikurensis NBRC 102666]